MSGICTLEAGKEDSGRGYFFWSFRPEEPSLPVDLCYLSENLGQNEDSHVAKVGFQLRQQITIGVLMM